MNKSIGFVLYLLGLITVLSFTGCQSTPKQEAKNTALSAPSDSAAIAAKQQEYDQMVQEWKTLKPGLKRMLAIEEEMNLLIGQLTLLQSVTQNQSTETASAVQAPAKPKPSAPSHVAAPVETVKVETPRAETAPALSDSSSNTQGSAHYALQVASLTELKLLPKKWQEMQRAHPQLLADLEPNFQSIKVNNTTYFRLKIGAFNTAQEANKKCSELIAVGISCIPAKYTESNFAQI